MGQCCLMTGAAGGMADRDAVLRDLLCVALSEVAVVAGWRSLWSLLLSVPLCVHARQSKLKAVFGVHSFS